MTTHVVVGGCGFLGRHIVSGLLREGARVRVVDVIDFPRVDVRPEVAILDLSTATSAECDHIIGNADVVHHYAWTTIPSTATAEPFRDLRENLGVTIGLLESLKRRGGGRIVFSSSGGTVYGKLQAVPVPESHPLVPISAYGVSKVAAEKYFQYYHTVYGIDARIARIANPYGAGQSPKRPQGAVTTFVHRALADEPIEIWGDGEIVRDFIHIADVVTGLLALATIDTIPNAEMAIYNIGSGYGTSLNGIVGVIEEHLGRPLLVLRKPGRGFDVPVSILDITRVRSEIGWTPRLSLAEGVSRMVTDLRRNPSTVLSSLDLDYK